MLLARPGRSAINVHWVVQAILPGKLRAEGTRTEGTAAQGSAAMSGQGLLQIHETSRDSFSAAGRWWFHAGLRRIILCLERRFRRGSPSSSRVGIPFSGSIGEKVPR